MVELKARSHQAAQALFAQALHPLHHIGRPTKGARRGPGLNNALGHGRANARKGVELLGSGGVDVNGKAPGGWQGQRKNGSRSGPEK